MKALDNAFSFHQNALRLRTLRQEVLAANIANADTPGYKAKDFDFKDAMSQAVQSGNPSDIRQSTTHPAHLPVSSISGLTPKFKFREVEQDSVDGNTVDLDVERSKFAENGLRYDAGITLLNGKIKQLLTAIQGE